ncbi:uncharacterized protein LOC141623957 [Silene latifolia]|uniref:uncharacterized protein LOC141623957 n=1 Tax=Silene latifolia TaxID=37657 RepID=UPI003D77065E
MTKLVNIIPVTRHNSGDMPSFSDTVFGFLDENYPLSENSSEDMFESKEWEEEDDEEPCMDSEDRKAFWDEQEKRLTSILFRTSSTESKVRNATKDGLKKLIGNVDCECRRDVSDGCPDCLRQGMYNHLCSAGFICLLQKSKWKSCHEIPSGEHTYLEVKEESSRNKGEMRVIIELNLRAEFEMAKASQEYNKLIKKLPQVYVGKPERLRNIVKILCTAAKICMKDNKMHLAPWRKLKYMQAKWLNNCYESNFTKTTENLSSETNYSDRRLMKPRASMLTRSLIKGLSATHCQIVEVI